MTFYNQPKDGFTLMELMVYIALLGGIVLIAGQAFNDSTRMRVRTQSMLQSNQTAGNTATLLKEDIAQIGAKSAKDINSSSSTLDVFDVSHIHDVYMDPDNATEAEKDSSSYKIWKNSGGQGLDKITMRRLRYKNDGSYDAVEEVSWFTEDNVLKRSCKSFQAETENEDCPSEDSSLVNIAENVTKFTVTAAKPTISATATSVLPTTSESIKTFKLVPRFGDGNFEPVNIEAESDNLIVRISGFSINYDFVEKKPITNEDDIKANQVFLANIGDDLGSWSSQCTRVNLVPYTEYEISFSMPKNDDDDPSRMFCPGRDHMAVGFRYADNGKKPDGLSDFQFYPPTVGDVRDIGLRHMRFMTKDTIKDVCMAFTFAMFSPIASTGNIRISEVKLRKIASSNYKFTDEAISTIDKKNVKAIRIELAVSKNGENGAETIFIPIPSNGPRD